MSERKSKWDEPSTSGERSASDAATAAAAAAAKIAAQFSQAQSSASIAGAGDVNGSSAAARTISSADGQTSSRKRDRDPHEGEFVQDIEINDLRNRYMLTKTQTQTQIHDDTGAVITTKGLWYPEKAMATEADPPLYLHVSAHTKDALDKAVEQLNEIINSELPQLIEDRQAKRQEYEQRRAAPAPPQRREWTEERVSIGLESLRNFNVRAKVVGPQGLFVKYIQNETATRVQIKGQGSGFIESGTGYESVEPMFIAIAGPDAAKVAEAKELAEDLVDAVKTEHTKAQQIMHQQWGGAQQFHHQQQQHQHQQSHGPHGGAYAAHQGYAGAAGHAPQHHPQHDYGASDGRQGWNAAGPYASHQPPQPHGDVPPPPEEDAPPPPPPADDGSAPPPPAHAADNNVHVKKTKTPEEEALEKYWKDYVEWEKSFKAYHNRLPSQQEGLQDVPPEFRS